MNKYEEKNCPRCNVAFECKVSDILHCQCYLVKLSEKESDFIAKQFTDCLCANCMELMKTECHSLQ